MGTNTKEDTIKEFQIHDHDTGSVEVQVAILTKRINHLVEHLKQHKKDHATRKGLIVLVGKRKRFSNYLRRKNYQTFLALSKKLKLKITDAK